MWTLTKLRTQISLRDKFLYFDVHYFSSKSSPFQIKINTMKATDATQPLLIEISNHLEHPFLIMQNQSHSLTPSHLFPSDWVSMRQEMFTWKLRNAKDWSRYLFQFYLRRLLLPILFLDSKLDKLRSCKKFYRCNNFSYETNDKFLL